MEPMIHKTTTTTIDHTNGSRRAAVNGLAVVGFIALLFIGVTLAIYAARYLPDSLSRLGAANVYFASFFSDDEGDNELEVVPGDSVPFEDGRNDEGEATTTPAVATTTSPTPTEPTTPRPTTPVITVVPVPGTQPTPYGKADLSIRLLEVGYLRTSSTDSFVKASRVPEGERAAFRFRVTNIGTNNTGTWEFEAELPTSPRYTYKSRSQSSLAPSQYADYTLGYDRARDGENRVTIEIDSDRDVDEISESNNDLSFEIEVED
jgi:hypothetical protein